MTAAQKLNLISVEDYLAGELVSYIKHEYLGGAVYAMAGARDQHDIISVNLLARLPARLHEKGRCRPHSSDMKVRVQLPTQTRFYYPDTSVICKPNPMGSSFQDQPAIIFEVLSKKTRRIDEGEKKDAYLTIPSLSVYALVEQELARIVVHRRMLDGFVREVYDGMDAILPLPEVEIELPLAEVYEGVDLRPEPEEEEYR